MTRCLRELGYTVLEAGNVTEALRPAGDDRRPPELVVSDVIMPGLDGVRLRALLAEAHPHLPVLFMSGIAPEELVRQGRVEAGSPILRKPSDPAALAAEVRRSLGVASRN